MATRNFKTVSCQMQLLALPTPCPCPSPSPGFSCSPARVPLIGLCLLDPLTFFAVFWCFLGPQCLRPPALLLPLPWPPPYFPRPCPFFLLVCPPTLPVPAPWTALLERPEEYEETEVQFGTGLAQVTGRYYLKRPFVPWAQVTPRRCLRKCSSSLQSCHAKLAAYFSVHQRLGFAIGTAAAGDPGIWRQVLS